MGFICLIYVATLAFLPFDLFWSVDEGAKYIQLHTLLGGQSGPEYQLPYLGQRYDPGYRFYPAHEIFPQPQPDGSIRFHWPIWFPLLSSLPFRWFGVGGLYLIPVVSGLLIVWFSGWLTDRLRPGLGSITMLVVGLSTPIFFYSLLFWEHTLAVLLGLLALVLIVNLNPDLSYPGLGISLVGGGGVLLLAVALRLEMLAYAVSLLLGLGLALVIYHWGQPSGRAMATKIGLGAGLCLLGGVIVWLLSPLWLTVVLDAGWLGPRLRELLATIFYFSGHIEFWRHLPEHLQAFWINTSLGHGPVVPVGWVWLGSVAFLVAGVGGLLPSPQARMGSLISSGVLLGAVSLYALLWSTDYRTIHSFYLISPLLILMFPLIRAMWSSRNFAITLLVTTCLVYLIFGTLALILRQVGQLTNLEWGPRYLLALYPLAAICTVGGGGYLYQTITTTRLKITCLALSGTLFLVGLGYQIRGVEEIYQAKADLQPYAQAVQVVSPRPLVTDLMWLPAGLGVYFVDQEIYVLNQREDLYLWLEQAEGRVDTFVFAGFFLLNPDFIAQAPAPLEATGSRLINGITFTEYKILGNDPPE